MKYMETDQRYNTVLYKVVIPVNTANSITACYNFFKLQNVLLQEKPTVSLPS